MQVDVKKYGIIAQYIHNKWISPLNARHPKAAAASAIALEIGRWGYKGTKGVAKFVWKYPIRSAMIYAGALYCGVNLPVPQFVAATASAAGTVIEALGATNNAVAKMVDKAASYTEYGEKCNEFAEKWNGINVVVKNKDGSITALSREQLKEAAETVGRCAGDYKVGKAKAGLLNALGLGAK